MTHIVLYIVQERRDHRGAGSLLQARQVELFAETWPGDPDGPARIFRQGRV